MPDTDSTHRKAQTGTESDACLKGGVDVAQTLGAGRPHGQTDRQTDSLTRFNTCLEGGVDVAQVLRAGEGLVPGHGVAHAGGDGHGGDACCIDVFYMY